MRYVLRFLLLLILGLYPAMVHAADVKLAWTASTSTGITGYQMHYGNATGTYATNQDAGNQTTGIITNLTPGQRYFFAVTVYDAFGQKSNYSNEVAYTVPLPSAPVAPTQLLVTPRL